VASGTASSGIRIARREVLPEDYSSLPEQLHPVLRRVYAARRMPAAELNPSLASLLPVSSLAGAAHAASVLAEARRRQSGILVVGDYDADGATASALVVSCLRRMGFTTVSYLVPNRFGLGYGLTPAVADLAASLRPDLLVTVDNGISSIEGVERARALGMQVIVTDHHLPGAELPRALAIVNPNLPGEAFASKHLAGVGVAFYVMAALARELDRLGVAHYEETRHAVAACLDLVALGTVADLVRLDHNNRILVAEGLRRIRAGQSRPGIAALFAVGRRDPRAARSADLGFVVAPRLNAAGRLTDMSLGVECLLTPSALRARELAAQLDALNAERRGLQARMEAEALVHMQEFEEQIRNADQAAWCFFDDRWHEGIVGLVASRLKDRTNRAVVAFAPGEEPGLLKGSARSVEGLHIRDVFAAIAGRGEVPGMSFGGHAMAAGLRLPRDSLDAFRAAFVAEVGRQSDGTERGRVLWTDGPLDGGHFSLELAETLQQAVPWGQGFPEPLFDNAFEVIDRKVLRDAHLRLTVRPGEGCEPVEAIAFRQVRDVGPLAHLVYRLAINDYGGRRRAQLVVEHIHSD
jgi:single-stranded-DNA-specific exonuclease